MENKIYAYILRGMQAQQSTGCGLGGLSDVPDKSFKAQVNKTPRACLSKTPRQKNRKLCVNALQANSNQQEHRRNELCERDAGILRCAHSLSDSGRPVNVGLGYRNVYYSYGSPLRARLAKNKKTSWTELYSVIILGFC